VTYDDKQQKEHREAFINECRQKAWGAACHADWISKNIDEILARYTKLQEEDRTLDADSKELAGALDSHTVENRNKRKGIQEKRDKIKQEMQVIAASAQKGQQVMTNLLQSVESNLALAKHAESWEWKEVEQKA
jgi:hypothetical protein